MRLVLIDYGYDIHAAEDEKYNFVISIATGDYKFEDIVNWHKAKYIAGGNIHY